MTFIAVTNASTVCNDADVALMTRACAHQLRYHVGPAWGRHPSPVVFVPFSEISSVPPKAWIFNVLDDSDQAGALAWHTEDQGDKVYGRVFAKTILDAGGDVLTQSLSVASALSHEIVETECDPSVNLWVDNGQGELVACEAADPVESDAYTIHVGGQPVAVSDFVTPAWFDAQADPGDRFDWLSQVTGPFQLAAGGYCVKLVNGQVTEVFGENYPSWRRTMKAADTARTFRRVHG